MAEHICETDGKSCRGASGYFRHQRRGTEVCDPCWAAKRVYAKKLRDKDPEKIAKQKRESYYRNREKVLAYTHKYNEDNREKIRAQKKKRHARLMADPEYAAKRKAANRQWKLDNPEKARASSAPYFEALAGKKPYRLAPHIAERDGSWNCAYCGKDVSDCHEVDHVWPVSKADRYLGGDISELDNLVLACRSCNASKNNKTLAERYGFIEVGV